MRHMLWIAAVTLVTGNSAVGQEILPAAARGIAVEQSKGYAVERIGEGLYFVDMENTARRRRNMDRQPLPTNHQCPAGGLTA